MKDRNFALQPWAPTGPCPDLRITGKIAWRGSTLTIHYELCGRLAEVAIPAPAAAPARRDRLWEETCMEFFLARPGAPQYWEFNLSPTGDWNVYRFINYRQGPAAEPAFPSLPFAVQSRPGSWRLTLEVDLSRIVPADQALEVAIAAVIRAAAGRLTYWALTHPGPRPDFHRRDGFLIAV